MVFERDHGVLIIGFPVAVLVSWFFEFTPDGIRLTVPSNEIQPLRLQATDMALAAAGECQVNDRFGPKMLVRNVRLE